LPDALTYQGFIPRQTKGFGLLQAIKPLAHASPGPHPLSVVPCVPFIHRSVTVTHSQSVSHSCIQPQLKPPIYLVASRRQSPDLICSVSLACSARRGWSLWIGLMRGQASHKIARTLPKILWILRTV
jgi:hypothetical protein